MKRIRGRPLQGDRIQRPEGKRAAGAFEGLRRGWKVQRVLATYQPELETGPGSEGPEGRKAEVADPSAHGLAFL